MEKVESLKLQYYDTVRLMNQILDRISLISVACLHLVTVQFKDFRSSTQLKTDKH